MDRRRMIHYTCAAAASCAFPTRSEAFVGPLLALLGRSTIQLLSEVAGVARAERLLAAATRARFNFNPQFTLSTGAEVAIKLKPRIRISTPRNGSTYRSPTIYIREVNLTLNQSRDITIQPMTLPPGFEAVHDIDLVRVPYVGGCDYVREIVSVDECGCEARWQPEAIAILGRGVNEQTPLYPSVPSVFPYGSNVPCPQVSIGNGMARCQ